MKDITITRHIDANAVSRLAAGDHRLRQMIDQALASCGYVYDIHNDWWLWNVEARAIERKSSDGL